MALASVSTSYMLSPSQSPPKEGVDMLKAVKARVLALKAFKDRFDPDCWLCKLFGVRGEDPPPHPCPAPEY